MPKMKKIPKLEDLCLRNIVRNIQVHGEQFKIRREHEAHYDHYTKLQFLFTNEILEKFVALLHLGEAPETVKHILWSNAVSSSEDNPSYLDFLFNEYTCCVDSFMEAMKIELTQRRLFCYILSKCKKLKSVNCLTPNFMYPKSVFGVIPNLRDLQSFYLGSPERRYCVEILLRILETCPFIKKFSMKDGQISDLFIPGICKHCPDGQFIFCPEDGDCCKTGKYLQHLHIEAYGYTSAVVACMLQHFPMLKSLVGLPWLESERYLEYLPDVPEGIMTLHDAAIARGKWGKALKLTEIFFKNSVSLDQLRVISSCCTKLESVQLNLSVIGPEVFTIDAFKTVKELHFYYPAFETLNSSELEQFLYKQKEQIRALSFYEGPMNLNSVPINTILKICCKVKELSFYSFPFVFDEFHDTAHLSLPSLSNLEKIIWNYTRFGPNIQYLIELLTRAKNIKSLAFYDASPGLLEQIMEIDFSNLEELHSNLISSACIEKLSNSENSLRNIFIVNPLSSDSIDLTALRNMIRENNFDLEINACNTYILFEL